MRIFAHLLLFRASVFSEVVEAPERRTYGVPLVSSLDFLDTDLTASSVGGTLTWAPPAVADEVASYTIYFADSTGSSVGRSTLGSVPVGTNSFAIPAGTSYTGNLTHFFVHSSSNLGLSPQGAGIEICDVSITDTVFLQNAKASTSSWGVLELSFHRMPDCSDTAISFVQTGDSGYSGSHIADNAFDGDTSTPWESSCSACAIGDAAIGIVGVCKPDEVRCVKLQQCTAGHPNAGCSSAPTASRMQRVSLIAKGAHVFTWNSLQGQTASVQPALEIEMLTVPSRRRRATMSAFVDVSYQVQANAEVNPGFSSR